MDSISKQFIKLIQSNHVFNYGIVAFIAITTSLNTLENGFVWDDRAAVIKNPDVLSYNGHSSILQVFQHDFWGTPVATSRSHKSYRPITTLSYRLNHYFDDFSSWSYHLINIIIHAGVTCLVWKLGYTIFSREFHYPNLGATIAAILFAVHPVHCDAIASIVGRADLLCTFFSLSGVLVYDTGLAWTYSREKHNGMWITVAISLVLCLAASLSKELGFTTLALYLVLEFFRFVNAPSIHPFRSSYALHRSIILIVSAAVAIAFRIWINGREGQGKWNVLANHIANADDSQSRWLTYAHVHSLYLWKLIWPRWLCFDYGFNTIPLVLTLWDPRNILSIIAYFTVVIALVGGGIYINAQHSEKSKRISTAAPQCFLFACIPFIPASNIFFPVGTVLAERLLYFPSVGFCLLVGYLMQTAIRKATMLSSYQMRTSHNTKYYQMSLKGILYWLYIAPAIILFAGAYRSTNRNREWKNEETLFTSALQVAPMNVKVLSNVGQINIHSNKTLAIECLLLAITLAPRHIESHLNIGLAYSADGQTLQALRHLIKATQFSLPQQNYFAATGYFGSELYHTWMNEHPKARTSMLLQGSPTIQNAKLFLDNAINRQSWYPLHYYTRGLLAYHTKEYQHAQQYFHTAKHLNDHVLQSKFDQVFALPYYIIYNMLGVSYKSNAQNDEALSHLLHGLELYPMDVDLTLNTMYLYLERKDIPNFSKIFYKANNLITISNVETFMLAAQVIANLQEKAFSVLMYEQIARICELEHSSNDKIKDVLARAIKKKRELIRTS